MLPLWGSLITSALRGSFFLKNAKMRMMRHPLRSVVTWMQAGLCTNYFKAEIHPHLKLWQINCTSRDHTSGAPACLSHPTGSSFCDIYNFLVQRQVTFKSRSKQDKQWSKTQLKSWWPFSPNTWSSILMTFSEWWIQVTEKGVFYWSSKNICYCTFSVSKARIK